ncbi:DUF4855 domain-containing protein [Thermococcus sp.]|nr:DUF4855 domain-containing protein [Thermococcus sp.]
MTLEGRGPTSYYEVVQWFKDRGFDRVVFLGGEGKRINYTGDGYEDGRYLALWIMSHVDSIKYYITIPFSYGNGELRDDPSKGFANSYWKKWIDGVLSVFDSNRLGFYWSYESCLQATTDDPALKVLGINDNQKEQYKEAYIQFIEDMSNYIHDHVQELIWIPATGTRSAEYLKNNSGIPVISEHFDYVFVQPNYYQYNSTYTYEKLVEKIRWICEDLPGNINNPNTTISIEMEADSAVLLGQCGHCASCRYENNHCVWCDNEKCLERACDYSRAIMEVNPSAFPTRAYYFGTDLRVIDGVREKCQGW